MLLNTLKINRSFAIAELVQTIKKYQVTDLIPAIEEDGELMEVHSYHICYKGIEDNMHKIELVFIPKEEDYFESCFQDLYKGNSGQYTNAVMHLRRFNRDVLYSGLEPKDFELKNEANYNYWFSSVENFIEFSEVITPLLNSELEKFS